MYLLIMRNSKVLPMFIIYSFVFRVASTAKGKIYPKMLFVIGIKFEKLNKIRTNTDASF